MRMKGDPPSFDKERRRARLSLQRMKKQARLSDLNHKEGVPGPLPSNRKEQNPGLDRN